MSKRRCTMYTFEYKDEKDKVKFIDIPLLYDDNDETLAVMDDFGVEIPDAITDWYDLAFEFMEPNFDANICNYNIYYDVNLGKMVKSL